MKELQQEMSEVQKRLSRVDDIEDEGNRKDITDALNSRADNIRTFQKRLESLTPAMLSARKAERELAAGAEEARKKAEELREELGKGIEELAKVKADDSFGALSALEKRNKLLSDAGANSEKDIEWQLKVLEIALRNNRLSSRPFLTHVLRDSVPNS